MELIWITSAKPLNDFKILISFNDGKIKTVNLENHLDKPVFQPLKGKDYF